MSAGGRPSIAFKKQLFNISNKLTDSDVKSLKFVCGAVVTKRVLGGITTGIELFNALEDVNCLSPDNLVFLQELLDSVSKGHLVAQLRDALASSASRAEDESGRYETAPPSLSPTDPSSIKFETFLVSLGQELPEKDLKNSAYFFRGFNVTGLSVQEVQRLREPTDLFDILKQEKVIAATDVGKLRQVMEAIGRIDLRDKVDEYTEEVGRMRGGRVYILDSGSEFSSLDSRVVSDPRPRLPHPQEEEPRPQLMQPKTGLPDYPRPQTVEEGGAGGGANSHLMVAGNAKHRVAGPAVAMEESQMGQSEEGVAQSVQGAVGKMVGFNSGRSITHAPEGPGLSSRHHTRTQLLQLDRNEAMERARRLEDQLVHERLHSEGQRQDRRGLEEELRRKNREVNGLLQRVAHLDGQLQTGDETEMYPMNSIPPHGKAIIIMNDSFTHNPMDPDLELRPRRGAKQDMSLFKSTFEFLGYEVECYPNLTRRGMYQVIGEVATRNHDNYDSFVCCVSTHGNEEVMYGVDSAGASRSELIHMVKCSETLRGKPKMFFIQACRTKPTSSATTKENLTSYQPNAPEQDADVFIANATTANSASFRDPSTGSWFVSTLHRIFTGRGPHLTLTALMHEVNREVCDAQGVIREEDLQGGGAAGGLQARQCAEITSSFRNGLRFRFPSQ